MSSQKEIERNARKAAIEAMTAELLCSNPMDLYAKTHQPALDEEKEAIDDDHEFVTGDVILDKGNIVADQYSFPSSSSSSSSTVTGNHAKATPAPETSSNKSPSLDEFAEAYKIPISHQVDLKGHTKAVMAISVDSSGNRVVSGSLDYQTKIYDFGGMDSRFRAFTSFEPSEGHPVISVCHSPQGDKFIIGSGSCQPKIFDRDGNLIITFVRGDMYIRDMSNTKGHTMEVTGVCWHPTEANTVITTSLDGTMRIWDLLGEAVFGNLVNKHVLKIRSMVAAAQTRIGGTCCTITSNGKYYIAGASDGSIHIWQEKRSYSRPDIMIKSAHGVGSKAGVVRCVVATNDSSKLLSRGEDELIKVWDLKRPTAPLKVFSACPNPYPTANIAISPDNKFLICGVSSKVQTKAKPSENNSESNESSALLFYDLESENISPRMQLTLPDVGSIIYVKWVASTNQILCSSSCGNIRVFYDPRLSKKGALLSSAKPAKREMQAADYAVVGEIINPNALPLFRSDPRQNHKRLRELKDATVPERPKTQGPGTRLNTSFFFTQYVTDGQKKNSLRDEDPREALLRVDAVAKADPLFTGNAYKDTQPKPLLTSMTFEEEQEEFKKKQKQQLN